MGDPTDGIFLARPERPPEGIALAVKDLLDTAGLTTTYGSVLFAEHVPSSTAESVLLLEAAGYANVGKTNLHEFAYGTTSENPHFGTVPNPLAPGRVAGGSSGGSAAAIAAGLAHVALGTDSGGSIRIPAACCGIVGFKPTFDRVPTGGCWPLAPSFDHIGPMARSVATCGDAMDVLAPDSTGVAIQALEEVDVGVTWLDDADPLVRARVEQAARLFPRRRAVELPRADGVGPLFMREVADVHRELFAEHADAYGEDLRAKVERCLAVSDAEVASAERARSAYRERVQSLVGTLDLIVSPTLPCVAPRIGAGGTGDLEVRERLTHNTFSLNALGWPALAVPCGPAEDGLPASVQLAASAGADGLVLAAGALLEAQLGTRATPAK